MDNPLKPLVAKTQSFFAAVSSALTVSVPKVSNKQQSIASYLPTAAGSTAQLAKRDLNTANVDLTSTFRLGGTTKEIIRNLVRVSPDLASAVSAYIRVGIPETYTCVARNSDGSVNADATRLAMQILTRMDKMPDYESGFSHVGSLRSVSEALAKELLIEGAASMELVLDKQRLPFKFSPIAVSQIFFFPDKDGLRPVQRLGGVDTDLDSPTFFYVGLDPSTLDPYSQSPLEAAVQPVLASATFLSDLRRVSQRHVFPRYDISIDEEKLRLRAPPDVLNDDAKRTEFLNGALAEVNSVIQNLGPEDAITHYDFFNLKYVEGGGDVNGPLFGTIQSILDAKVSTGARTMPSILGHGSGSSNVASSETLLFMLSANSMVRLKLNELFSKAMTLALRLHGMDVSVDFKYADIELRPESELTAFRVMQQSRILEQLSLGFLTDEEASIILTGHLPPNGFKPLSGTNFKVNPVDPNTNPLGNQQGTMNQSLKPKTPQKPKS